MQNDTFYARLLPPGKEWYTPPEIAPLVGRTPQYIRNAIGAGVIQGHCSRPGSTRQSHVVHRDALLLYLRQTALYEPEDFLHELAQVIDKLPPVYRRELNNMLMVPAKKPPRS